MSEFIEFTYRSAKSALRLYFEPLRWFGRLFYKTQSVVQTNTAKPLKPTREANLVDWGREPSDEPFIIEFSRMRAQDQAREQNIQQMRVEIENLINKIDTSDEVKEDLKNHFSALLAHPLFVGVLAELLSHRVSTVSTGGTGPSTEEEEEHDRN